MSWFVITCNDDAERSNERDWVSYRYYHAFGTNDTLRHNSVTNTVLSPRAETPCPSIHCQNRSLARLPSLQRDELLLKLSTAATNENCVIRMSAGGKRARIDVTCLERVKYPFQADFLSRMTTSSRSSVHLVTFFVHRHVDFLAPDAHSSIKVRHVTFSVLPTQHLHNTLLHVSILCLLDGAHRIVELHPSSILFSQAV